MESGLCRCNKNCRRCSKLNAKTDDKGYPWGYECLKFDNTVCYEKFGDTKEFTMVPVEKEAKMVKYKYEISGVNRFGEKFVGSCTNVSMERAIEMCVDKRLTVENIIEKEEVVADSEIKINEIITLLQI